MCPSSLYIYDTILNSVNFTGKKASERERERNKWENEKKDSERDAGNG